MPVTTQQVHDPIRDDMRRLWRLLGPGRTFEVSRAMRGSVADPLVMAIDEAVGAQVRGDHTRLIRLMQYGFVTVAPHPEHDHLDVWTLADTEPPQDTRTLVEREQAAINAAAARERQRMDQEHEVMQRAVDNFKAPYEAAERVKLVEMLTHPEVRIALREMVREEVDAVFEELRKK